jgi:hypothetical protein
LYTKGEDKGFAGQKSTFLIREATVQELLNEGEKGQWPAFWNRNVN